MMSRLKRNAMALLFGLLLGGAATWASAASVGAGMSGVCYENVGKAMAVVASKYPLFVGNILYQYVGYEPITVQQMEVALTHVDPVTFETVWEYPRVNLSICAYTPPEDLSTLVPNNFILICTAVLLWAVGFSVGQKR